MKSEKILIVGGGSAGWMTAATLIRAFPDRDITLLESPNFATVGVGESTIGKVKQWTKFLGIDDKEFLKHTDGIIKYSIGFTNFNGVDEGKPNQAPFHYPFGEVVTKGSLTGYNDWWMKKAYAPETPVSDYGDSFAPVMALVNQNKGAKEFFGFETDKDSAYHFDATKFGLWLKDHYCKPKGVKHILEDIETIEQDEDGIVSLNKKHKADLYIDCTGWKSMLLGGALKVPFQPIQNLPNNKAWATRIPYNNREKQLRPFTNCTALENGWSWNIPLWSRMGTGYVHCDKFVDKETALKEFKTHLTKTWGGDVESLEYRYIDMRCGIHERLFEKNVVAIGLAAGFIEPLESNGLFSVHEFLIELVRNLRRGEITQWDRDNHTFACKAIYHGFEEFVGLHYAMTTRNDTPYWKANNNKVWEESLRSMKPKMFLGYLQAALQRAKYYEFPVDPIERKGNSGLHFIAAGCNWAPDDIPNSVYRTHKTKEEILEILKPYIDKLNDNKEMWNREAEKQMSYEDFIKANYYD